MIDISKNYRVEKRKRNYIYFSSAKCKRQDYSELYKPIGRLICGQCGGMSLYSLFDFTDLTWCSQQKKSKSAGAVRAYNEISCI